MADEDDEPGYIDEAGCDGIATGGVDTIGNLDHDGIATGGVDVASQSQNTNYGTNRTTIHSAVHCCPANAAGPRDWEEAEAKHTRTARRKATEIARGILEMQPEEIAAAAPMVEQMLLAWQCHSTEKRKRVQRDEQPIQSDTLGATQCSVTKKWYISATASKYPEVTRALNEWLWWNLDPDSRGWFRWTTVIINDNFQADRHRDRNNVGPSAIATFGDYVGGGLFIWQQQSTSSGNRYQTRR